MEGLKGNSNRVFASNHFNTTYKCQCDWCIFSREYRDRLDALPIEHQEFFRGVLDSFLETSYDLSYWEAKAKGEI